jgi:hypothetical protein
MKYTLEALLVLSVANLTWYPESWVSLSAFVVVFTAYMGKHYMECYHREPVVVPFNNENLEAQIAEQQKSLSAANEEIKVLQSSVSKLALVAGFKTLGQK